MPHLVCSYVATSLFTTSIVTILNVICSATSKASPDIASTILSAVGMVALVTLGLVHRQNIQTGRRRLICSAGGYLVIAAAASAGLISKSPHTSIFIVRSVFWALSVFMQGICFGFFAPEVGQEKPNPEWPCAYSQELKDIPQTPNFLPSPPHVCDLSDIFEPKRSSLRKFPRRSSRCSDSTLCPSSTKEGKNAPIDTTSATHSSPSPSPTQDRMSDTFPDGDPRPLQGTHGISSIASIRRDPPPELSLDMITHPSVPSPTASTVRVKSPAQSGSNSSTWENNLLGEDNIHPLFRSTSPCPSPTYAPGTVVKASPIAGQTLTTGTITRMKSARSLRDQAMHTPSPLPESEETLGLRTTPTRGSFVQPSENKFENESPDEK
ncbi:hypothetical protein PENCOP_c012G02349 [Penicillium coprophilum]|uniref:Uncharacterized protein n=1 Tax=Penicillium coprophilum TaxID=36646 RepID=A0A1V6UCJ9_9EURO|nr:hypothetical protein PENCOP_c012G02349 [Penicillium coprophilum]